MSFSNHERRCPMAKDGLRGRTALITGGSRGIGAAISRALAEAGAGLAINYRERGDHAKNLADELLNTGVRAITVQADVSQPDAVAKMVEVVKSELGALDILVNNAASPSRAESTISPKPILIGRSP